MKIALALLFLPLVALAGEDCTFDFGHLPEANETYLLRVHSDDIRHDPHVYFIYTLTFARKSATCSDLGLLSYGSRIFEVWPGIRTEAPVEEEHDLGYTTQFYRSKIITVVDGVAPNPPTLLAKNFFFAGFPVLIPPAFFGRNFLSERVPVIVIGDSK